MQQARVSLIGRDMPDFAPSIYRQRLIVEGLPSRPVDEASLSDYLVKLSDVCSMRRLIEPVTHRSSKYGWAGWVHWEASGAHCYAWEQPVLFLSVDIYTCAPFDAESVVAFTADYFGATEIAAKIC